MKNRNSSLEIRRVGKSVRAIAVSAVVAIAGVSLEAGERPEAFGVGGRPKTVELGNGLFQLRLDPAVGTQAPDWLNGAIEWEYAGQATYARSRKDGQPASKLGPKSDLAADVVENHRILADDGAMDTLTRLLRSEMEDEHGRLFRVKRVDKIKLQDAVDAYSEKVERDCGCTEELPLEGVDDEVDPEPTPGEEYIPMTWYLNDQSGDGNIDRVRWNSEDRQAVWAPLTSRQEKVVIYFFGDIGSDAGHCSGTLIGDYWVLTAAHCTKNSAGTAWVYAEDTNSTDGQVEAKRGKVCTRGNFYSGAECANVTARWGNGGWGGTGDMGDDLVVMKIDQPLGSGNYMALSQASNSTIKSYTNFNLGFPGLTPYGANSNVFGTNCSFSSNGLPYAGYKGDADAPCESVMYWANDVVHKTSRKILGTKIDGSSGHSGGPYFYYPNGYGNSHFQTGLVSGWYYNTVTKYGYRGGPKIPYHRDWIIGIMDSH